MKSIVEHALRNLLITFLQIFFYLFLRYLADGLFIWSFKCLVILTRHVKNEVVIDLLVYFHYFGRSLGVPA